MQPLKYCVYILRSLKDGRLYIGYTEDLNRRLNDHNDGRNPSTAPRRPFELIFCEFYRSGADAQRREKYFKTTAGKRALKLMLRDTLTGAGE